MKCVSVGRCINSSSLTCFDVVVSVCSIEDCELHQLHLLQIVLSLCLQKEKKETLMSVHNTTITNPNSTKQRLITGQLNQTMWQPFYLLTTCPSDKKKNMAGLLNQLDTTSHLFSKSTSWIRFRETEMKISSSAVVMAECLVVTKMLTETLSMGMHIHNPYQNDNYSNFLCSLVRNQMCNNRPG